MNSTKESLGFLETIEKISRKNEIKIMKFILIHVKGVLLNEINSVNELEKVTCLDIDFSLLWYISLFFSSVFQITEISKSYSQLKETRGKIAADNFLEIFRKFKCGSTDTAADVHDLSHSISLLDTQVYTDLGASNRPILNSKKCILTIMKFQVHRR